MNALPLSSSFVLASASVREPGAAASAIAAVTVVDFAWHRVRRALRQRARYRYVKPRVWREGEALRIESPCCSRNVDARGGVVDIALLRPFTGSPAGAAVFAASAVSAAFAGPRASPVADWAGMSSAPDALHLPCALNAPEASDARCASNSLGALSVPCAPDVSDAPGAQCASNALEVPDARCVSNSSGTLSVPGEPDASDVPGARCASNALEVLEVPDAWCASNAPEAPDVRCASNSSGALSVPGAPDAPSISRLPNTLDEPRVPSASSVLNMLGAANALNARRGWNLYARDHARGMWVLVRENAVLDGLLALLCADPDRVFWP